jgi:NADPH-dependent 2,4-dienoyl-CoA reductase/sulfur reductase-like enzyme
MMERYELIVIGAGPSGLSAAIEAAKSGVKVIVFDENDKPGGQLFKQIHKFFGSKEHKAKVRGFRIGEDLLKAAEEAGVCVMLGATVIGLYPEKEVVVRMGGAVRHYKGDAIIVATGAMENAVPFEGWTMPGVMGAGAAQTMMNIHGVRVTSVLLSVISSVRAVAKWRPWWMQHRKLAGTASTRQRWLAPACRFIYRIQLSKQKERIV